MTKPATDYSREKQSSRLTVSRALFTISVWFIAACGDPIITSLQPLDQSLSRDQGLYIPDELDA